MRAERSTQYKKYVDAAINTMLNGCRSFTLAELSERTGMKVTPHFRKRIKQWVADGELIEEREKVVGGGSHFRYFDVIPF